MTQPSPADMAAAKARMYYDVNRYQDAGKAALEGLRTDPNNADLMGLLAAALHADGHAADARQWAERSLSFDPQQAWVHSVLARAILDGAGSPHEAVGAAHTAVTLDTSNVGYRYTLTRASLAARNRAYAQTVAGSIRGLDPNSALGPFAEALVELDRARFLQIRWGWAVVLIVLTRGLALVGMAVVWLVVAIRRTGPLRRADGLILEALRLDPGAAHTHALAAEVAHLRFRYLQSVDASLATAALDTGLIDADELAGKIVRATCTAAAVAFGFWCVPAILVAAHTPVPVGAAIGSALGLGAVACIWRLDRSLTGRLPAGLVRRVRGSWAPPITASVILVLVFYTGAIAGTRSPGLAVAALVTGGAIAAGLAALLVGLYSARRNR